MAATQQPALKRIMQRRFTGGELSEDFWFQSDHVKAQAGAAKLLNMIVLAQGGAAVRPGTQYVGTLPSATNPVFQAPFKYSLGLSYVLEFGDHYMRVIKNGQYIASGGLPYQIATPYAAADVQGLRLTQSADVVTITHPGYAPMTLSRLADTNWVLAGLTIGPTLPAPNTVISTATIGNLETNFTTLGDPFPNKNEYGYVVTAVNQDKKEESIISGATVISNYDLGYYAQYGVFNTISWSAVTGATHYNVYRVFRGKFAYIGTQVAPTVSFEDINYAPDTSNVAPEFSNPFASNNPATACYFQERLVFAGGNNSPTSINTSKSGNYNNFDTRLPLLDDDAINYTLLARKLNIIQHLVPMQDLIVMTADSIWRVDGNGGPISPNSFEAVPQAVVGASPVEPVLVGNTVLFVEAKGGSIREIIYNNLYAAAYTTDDLSILAPHLFTGYQAVAMAWAESPDKVLWVVRSDGALLSMTYLKDKDVFAWTQHSTDGQFLWVTVVPEQNPYGVYEDVPYFAVQRVINGVAVRFTERLRTRQLGPTDGDITQAWHVDCGLQYSGAPVSSVTQLDHLVGAAVVALADGTPIIGTVAAGGSLALANCTAMDPYEAVPATASRITVGLQYTAELRSLPLVTVTSEDSNLGLLRRVHIIRAAVKKSRGLMAGPDADNAASFQGLAGDEPGDDDNPMQLLTGVQELPNAEGWDRLGQISIVQRLPLPATIIGIGLSYLEGEL